MLSDDTTIWSSLFSISLALLLHNQFSVLLFFISGFCKGRALLFPCDWVLDLHLCSDYILVLADDS